jgi:hypothetical protein
VPECLFTAVEGGFNATELARGPWNPDAQHGGAAAALLMRELERVSGPGGLALARVTYEFMRPVPLGRLGVRTRVIRPGRRVQLLEASIDTPDGSEVVRSRALFVRPAETDVVTERIEPPPGPEHGRPNDFERRWEPMFATDAIEIRFVEGAFRTHGPATAWFRLRVPVVGDEDPSPLQRLAAAADFPNGISTVLSWDDHAFINADLTVYVDRPPAGEWIGLRARTRIAAGGVGIAEAVLFDHRGAVGRAMQALLIGPRS